MYVDKKSHKSSNPILTQASNDIFKYTGSPATINVNLTDNENH